MGHDAHHNGTTARGHRSRTSPGHAPVTGPKARRTARGAAGLSLRQRRAELEQRATGTALNAPANVAELCHDCIAWADRTYTARGNGSGGSGGGEAENMRHATREIREMYGPDPVSSIRIAQLAAVRLAMVDAGLSRRTINARVSKIRRIWSWAVERGFVEADRLAELRALSPHLPGRSSAPDRPPREPVAWGTVAATVAALPHVPADMALLGWWSGMRPGELVSMTAEDLDLEADPWEYRPRRHKGTWRSRERVVYLGPESRAIVARHLADKGPLWGRYTVRTWAQSIRRAAARAGVPHWSPGQLRHAAAQRIREEMGIETARVLLGHTDASTTAIYASNDQQAAKKAARGMA